MAVSASSPRPGPGAPASARVYDALLGGPDNYEADRVCAAELERIYPGVRRMVRDNRDYLGHAATWAVAHAGIRQFLDLGSGFPNRGSVRDIAQAAGPQARVACVDTDALVARYGAKLERDGIENVTVTKADIRDPAAVLASRGVTAVIDLAEPAALVFGLVVHHMTAERAREMIAGYVRPLAPGSCVIITAGRCGDPGVAGRFRQAYGIAHQNFTMDEIGALFGDLEVLPPGLGPVAGTRPGWAAKGKAPGSLCTIGGIGVRS